MARRRGTRALIVSQFACEPDGCGAAKGQPCVSYRDSWHGTAKGLPVDDVHAARWKQFHAWLREQGQAVAGGC